jgi:hypothetical protein
MMATVASASYDELRNDSPRRCRHPEKSGDLNGPSAGSTDEGTNSKGRLPSDQEFARKKNSRSLERSSKQRHHPPDDVARSNKNKSCRAGMVSSDFPRKNNVTEPTIAFMPQERCSTSDESPPKRHPDSPRKKSATRRQHDERRSKGKEPCEGAKRNELRREESHSSAEGQGDQQEKRSIQRNASHSSSHSQEGTQRQTSVGRSGSGETETSGIHNYVHIEDSTRRNDKSIDELKPITTSSSHHSRSSRNRQHHQTHTRAPVAEIRASSQYSHDKHRTRQNEKKKYRDCNSSYDGDLDPSVQKTNPITTSREKVREARTKTHSETARDKLRISSGNERLKPISQEGPQLRRHSITESVGSCSTESLSLQEVLARPSQRSEVQPRIGRESRNNKKNDSSKPSVTRNRPAGRRTRDHCEGEWLGMQWILYVDSPAGHCQPMAIVRGVETLEVEELSSDDEERIRAVKSFVATRTALRQKQRRASASKGTNLNTVERRQSSSSASALQRSMQDIFDSSFHLPRTGEIVRATPKTMLSPFKEYCDDDESEYSLLDVFQKPMEIRRTDSKSHTTRSSSRNQSSPLSEVDTLLGSDCGSNHDTASRTSSNLSLIDQKPSDSHWKNAKHVFHDSADLCGSDDEYWRSIVGEAHDQTAASLRDKSSAQNQNTTRSIFDEEFSNSPNADFSPTMRNGNVSASSFALSEASRTLDPPSSPSSDDNRDRSDVEDEMSIDPLANFSPCKQQLQRKEGIQPSRSPSQNDSACGLNPDLQQNPCVGQGHRRGGNAAPDLDKGRCSDAHHPSFGADVRATSSAADQHHSRSQECAVEGRANHSHVKNRERRCAITDGDREAISKPTLRTKQSLREIDQNHAMASKYIASGSKLKQEGYLDDGNSFTNVEEGAALHHSASTFSYSDGETDDKFDEEPDPSKSFQAQMPQPKKQLRRPSRSIVGGHNSEVELKPARKQKQSRASQFNQSMPAIAHSLNEGVHITYSEHGAGVVAKSLASINPRVRKQAGSDCSDSSESNTSGYSFGTGLRYVNPRVNLKSKGLKINSRETGQFVQLNFGEKEGVEIVDNSVLLNSSATGLHQRKTVPMVPATSPEKGVRRSLSDGSMSVELKTEHNVDFAPSSRRNGNSKAKTPSKVAAALGESLRGFGLRRSKSSDSTEANLNRMLEPDSAGGGATSSDKKTSFFSRRSNNGALLDDDDDSFLDM